MATETPPPPGGGITLEQLSQLLMVTPERVRQLHHGGYIPKIEKGRYPLVQAVQGYIRSIKDENKRASKSAAASRMSDAKTREIELRVAQRENVLIETDEAIGVVDEVVGALRADLAGLPARCTRDVDQRRKIQAEVNDILTRASDRFTERAEALRARGTAAPSEPDDDPG